MQRVIRNMKNASTLRNNQSGRSIAINAVMAAVSLFLNGFGVYLTIQANLGAAPWDVLHIGLSRTLNILYGTGSIAVSVIILIIDILLKEPVDWGGVQTDTVFLLTVGREHHRSFMRIYASLALIARRMKAEHLLEDHLRKDSRTSRAEIVPAGTKDAKKARLRYRVVRDAGEGKFVLQIRLETGRFHQIRAQLSHAGMPILGDRKYGGRPAETLALCAFSLSFDHPKTGRRMRFRLQERSCFSSEA